MMVGICVLLAFSICPAQPKPQPDSLKSPTGAMLRALAVPGWGQWYNGKKFKAVVVAGGEIGLVADAIIQNQLAVKATTEVDRLFYRDNRSLAIWWLAAVILYSMADAYVDAHLHGFDESTNLGMAPSTLNPQGPLLHAPVRGIKLCFSLGG